jgi:hypothetical protein
MGLMPKRGEKHGKETLMKTKMKEVVPESSSLLWFPTKAPR